MPYTRNAAFEPTEALEETTMLRIALIVAAITLAGCAGTREQRAAAFQQEVPQLVAACNGWQQSDITDGEVIRGHGLKGCSRLRDENSLRLADPMAVSAYLRYVQGGRTNQAAAAGSGAFPAVPGGATIGFVDGSLR
jgi:hypothetical protein